MISKPQHVYAWLFCGFAALGACIYGYDGVYFNGVSSLVSPPTSELHVYISYND
jgi:SP family sugar:H+ symporter-like MFS transporter